MTRSIDDGHKCSQQGTPRTKIQAVMILDWSLHYGNNGAWNWANSIAFDIGIFLFFTENGEIMNVCLHVVIADDLEGDIYQTLQ